MPFLLCALQKIHLGLLIQVDGVKDLSSAVKGKDTSDLSLILPILKLLTEAISSVLSKAAEESRESKEASAPKESAVPSIPVIVKQQLWLMVNEWHRRVQSGDIFCVDNIPLPLTLKLPQFLASGQTQLF